MSNRNQADTASGEFAFYATIDADADLLIDDPTNLRAVPEDGRPCRGIMVFTSGTLVVVRPDGVTVTMTSFPANVLVPIQCVEITDTGTTAAKVLVFW